VEHLCGKKVCVLGLGRSGKSAVNLLLKKKAHITAFDDSQHCLSQQEIEEYKRQGVIFSIGSSIEFPRDRMDLAVVSPGIPSDNPLVKHLVSQHIPIWSELELAWRESLCPSIAVSGTNGKTTVTSWIEKVLLDNGCRTIAAGNFGTPLSDVVVKPKKFDFFTLEVSSFQLEHIKNFKPKIALLLNVAEDHLDRHGSADKYFRIKARLFENQRADDYAIADWEVLQRLKQKKIYLQSRTLTFSEHKKSADLYLEEGLVKSQMHGWPETVIDLNKCNFRGYHNATNLMAVLLVGKVLGLPLEKMIRQSIELRSGAHRCEFVAECNGVKFYNDSKATNVHALTSALCSMPQNTGDRRNIWLIAGGQNKAFDFRAVTKDSMWRVKSAYLLGQSSAEMLSAWQSFVPCNLVDNMVEAVSEAGRNAVPGDVVLLSPACASFDMFDSYQHRGDSFCAAVQQWMVAMNGD
tara:strand:- start:1381 stop:2769 length:1389 start_codon:yes stop_codon:yes gene_type:complete